MALNKKENVILTPKAEGSKLKYSALSLAAMAMFIFAACSDDVTDVTEVTEVTQVIGMQVVEEGDSLPKCSMENEGDIVYSVDSAAAYYCVNRTWTSIRGKDGADGKDGKNGENGKDGKNGTDGKNGADGDNGIDGKNCEIVSDTNGITTLKCGNGTTTLYKAMCDLTPYDPTQQYCSIQGIFDLKKCGGKLYNPETHFCDTRDSSLYRYVTIGSQVWMAENLNYKVDSSFCYNDSVEYCDKYGRLYSWSVAIDSILLYGSIGKVCGYGKTCTLPAKTRGVCPYGWHLPDSTELQKLVDEVGGAMTAGKVLKSRIGWLDNGNGIDSYGFSALPAGYRNAHGTDRGGEGYYRSEGYLAQIWSITEIDSAKVYYIYLNYGRDEVHIVGGPKEERSSIRCIKN